MKFYSVTKTLAATAVALLISGCGGGGGGGETTAAPAASLDVSGTAAVGAALANATVDVKCATGSGTATTNASGGYTVTLEGGALPCIVRVTGTAAGATVTLHSVTEAGTTNAADAKTSAVANVTPVTEIIVAQLTKAMPSDSFATFDPAVITPAAVASASTAVVDALKAAGVDLGAIDPLKAPLVPATGTTQGNTYDQLLDTLGDKIAPEALPLVVNQIVVASTSGTQTTTGLTDAMTAVSGGALAGCPTALSGKYRTIEYWGRTSVREVNFGTGKFMSGNGVDSYDITVDPAKPCAFTAKGTINGVTSEFDVVMGPSGLGSFRARQTAPSTTVGVIGYIFPVQSHTFDTLLGTWDFLESGYAGSDGFVHWFGKATVSSDRRFRFCDYDTTWTCVADTEDNDTVTDRTDGGFDIVEAGVSGFQANLFAYRAPNGSVTLFGTTNPTGATGATVTQTSFVATKLTTASLPAVGTTTKYWDVTATRSPSGASSTFVPVADSVTIVSADAAAGTVVRKRESDGREDTVQYNKPVAGMRSRAAGTWNGIGFSGVYQLPLPGTGMVVAVNNAPSSSSTHLFNLSVVRP